MKKKLSKQEAEILLERYYEGLTSVAEEKKMQTFLLRKNLPEHFNADKAILSYFAGEKEQPKTVNFKMLQWGSIAATILVAILCIKTFPTNNRRDYAFINGKKITDVQVVRAEALASIEVFSNSLDEVKISTEAFKNDDVVRQQLENFINIQ
jgi:hypothetical protein